MNLSVIIPTYNASKYIDKLINALRKQTIQDFELIVIDSSSNDDTVEKLKKYNVNPIIIPKSEFDHGGTRTLGAKKASGEIIIFFTHDAIPADNFAIENIIRPILENKNIAAVYGKQLPSPDATPFASHLRLFNYPESSHVRVLKDREKYGFKTTFLSDSFSAYKRSVLSEIGWFKENLIFGEDAYAGAKFLLAGYEKAYASDARVYHSHNYTIIQEFKRYFDIGVFHKSEEWMLKEFGKIESEGRKFFKSEILYLIKNKNYNLLPESFVRTALKLLGYKIGKSYYKLPKYINKRLSMYGDWWDK